MQFKKSINLFNKIYQISPGGMPAIRRPYNFIQNKYPIFFDHGYGSKIFDVDGNKFIDMLCGYGPVIIGYRNNVIDKAVISQIKYKGNCMTLTQPTQYQLTQKINKIFNTDKTIIVKTGSDATHLSIKLAKSYNDKNLILRCGYHGWHEWCGEDKYKAALNVSKNTISLEYNNLEDLKKKFKKYKNKLAAVIIWPIHTPLGGRVVFPNNNYMSELRKLCNQYNVVLIFDEIRSAFRVDENGAQSFLKVKPDLTILGKAIANGYAVSAVTGKKEIMDQAFNKVFVSSTFFGNSLDQIAAIETINFLKKNKVYKNIKNKGLVFIDQISKSLKKLKIECKLSGSAWFPQFTFENKNAEINLKASNIFYSNLIEKGIFMSPYHHSYFMHSHSKKDLIRVIEIIKNSIDLINKKI